MYKNPDPGLRQLSDGAYAWLAHEGGWGWSNAGLIVDGDQSLLVDTLFDLALTADMLAEMRRVEAGASRIETLVNTHANGDHCHGNSLVTGAEIIASSAAALEMAELTPETLHALKQAAQDMGAVGQYFLHCFGEFNFADIPHCPPTRTFDDTLDVNVGDKPVHLINVGPAHTRGDVLVYSPNDRAVFTGDILFIEGTPIMWQGPVGNWISACRHIEAMDVEHIVPGHGPLTDRQGVAAVRHYLEYVNTQARIRYDGGMTAQEAALDIDISAFSDWSDPERIAVNVDSLYREFSNSEQTTDVLALFAHMAELAGFSTTEPGN